jgi:uncharacterized protein (TIGR02246 family)
MGAATDTIEKALERIRLTWNAGDARAYAAEFTEDATYVIFLGELLLGREEIERNHIDVLTKWRKGTQMAMKAISTTSLGDDAASVLTIGGLGKGDSIPYDKLQTFTFVRRGGRWMCAAFHNTEMSRRARRQYNSSYGRRTARSWRAWFRRGA